MVAFVNGKVTNASAHTSYLYLVKKPAPSVHRFFRYRESCNVVTAPVACPKTHRFDGRDRERFAPLISCLAQRKPRSLNLLVFAAQVDSIS